MGPPGVMNVNRDVGTFYNTWILKENCVFGLKNTGFKAITTSETDLSCCFLWKKLWSDPNHPNHLVQTS